MAAIGVSIVVHQWAAARPLWLDEEMIALNFRDRTFAGLGGRLWLDQSAPMGWLFLQRLILLTFGSSELAVRALPAAFGVATVIAALYVGRRWLTTEASTVLVVLCSIGQWISFHAVELKPYSADTFFGFLLPFVTVALATASSTETRRHAIVIWATIAIMAHWLSLGALLVLPACCVVLAISLRRHPETFRWLAAAAVILVASIAVHYVIGIRHAQGSASLQHTWAFALPPPDAGLWDRLQWMYRPAGADCVETRRQRSGRRSLDFGVHRIRRGAESSARRGRRTRRDLGIRAGRTWLDAALRTAVVVVRAGPVSRHCSGGRSRRMAVS